MIILLCFLYRIFILFIVIVGFILEDYNSYRNYFFVNFIIGKKVLVVFFYFVVVILIGFILKE